MIDPALAGLPRGARIVVAMSGGVDSSVTAGLLAGRGHDVVGITLQLYDREAAAGRAGACCAGQDVRDARAVADRLGIPHYVLDMEERFRSDVVAPFADSYVRGETPVPCVLCNQTVKFRDLLAFARDLGADALATGHYVRRAAGADGPRLYRAADRARDQSYFLFATTRAQLAMLRFPLGGLTKDEVRAHALRLGLDVAAKPDSQDICFVPDGRYARLVARLRPGAGEPGDIVDLAGRTLGRHDGIIGFTVGQRRGLRIGGRQGAGGGQEPLYVVRLDAASRQVVVGPRAALATRRVVVRDLNWLGSAGDSRDLPVAARLRSAQEPAPARLRRAGAAAELELAEPQFGVAPGQAAVLYDGDLVLGGGWIADAGSPAGAPQGPQGPDPARRRALDRIPGRCDMRPARGGVAQLVRAAES